MNAWELIKKTARKRAEKLGERYSDRLEIEIKEIEKQGANDMWVDLFKKQTKSKTNDNGLVLPLLLNLTKIDPIVGTQKIMIGDNKGKTMDAVEIELDNGRKVVVSPYTMVSTTEGSIQAKDLREGLLCQE